MKRTGKKVIANGPDERIAALDELVALNIRKFRCEAGLTQSDVATQLNISFQQVYKYEAGVNRVSAGRLYELAVLFGRPIQDFGRSPEQLSSDAGDSCLRRFMEAFNSIEPGPARDAIATFVRALSDLKQG